jgi:hypothetical protein
MMTARRHPTLQAFMDDRIPNLYVQYNNIDCYMRKGFVLIDGVKHTGLTIANICNIRRSDNYIKLEEYSRTGLFRVFVDRVERAAIKRGYDGVYVELVHNEFLPDVLLRYGYTRVNIRGSGEIQERNYWRSVK